MRLDELNDCFKDRLDNLREYALRIGSMTLNAAFTIPFGVLKSGTEDFLYKT
jgi:hypothetical protein